ncbi:SLC5A8_12 [Mytilus edulis]|uniref:SLC5A8_12 n=1 Tax=Mytilus edulis TaxID=6550 RepID=A0A8S3UU37_MYTED|nr:SLC5A8_12 [Mytilus edulis]
MKSDKKFKTRTTPYSAPQSTRFSSVNQQSTVNIPVVHRPGKCYECGLSGHWRSDHYKQGWQTQKEKSDKISTRLFSNDLSVNFGRENAIVSCNSPVGIGLKSRVLEQIQDGGILSADFDELGLKTDNNDENTESGGGLKAVMWTDAFQMFIVFAGLLTLIIKATVEVGGVSLVFEKAAEAGKLEIINFDPNPLVRHTFWTLVIGGFMTSMTIYGGNQAMVQRYISMKNVKGAQTALYLQMPASIIFTLLLVFTGLVLNAKYGDKNPVPCTIEKRDQVHYTIRHIQHRVETVIIL